MKIISGMHRSGTSLVAQIAYEAGAEMGDPGTFYRPDRWNSDGYFEQIDVHRINMPLVNGPWGRWSYFKLPSKQTILKRGRKLATEIRSAAKTYDDAVLKDPRFAITLPAWRAQGAEIESILVCLRDPSSVAGSLRRRNRASRGLSMRLWLDHNRRLLDLADEVPTHYLYYSDLLRTASQPVELAVLAEFLGLKRSSDEWRTVMTRCVKPGLDHNPPDSTSYPPAVAALWRELRDRHRMQSEVAG